MEECASAECLPPGSKGRYLIQRVWGSGQKSIYHSPSSRVYHSNIPAGENDVFMYPETSQTPLSL